MNIIDKNKKNCKSIKDYGCSQGYYSFYSYFSGYEVTMIEHDNEYVEQLKKIKNHLNLKVDIIHGKFSNENIKKSDITLFLPLIHWVYNCTDNFKSFNPIIDKLYKETNKILIIEWIDYSDNAIQSYHKNYIDKTIDKYNLEEFEKSLKIFSKTDILDSNNKTRKLYICYK